MFASQWLDWSRRRLLGPPKTVTLSASIIGFKDPLVLSNLHFPKAEFTGTNGIQVWILDDAKLDAARRSLKQTPGVDFVANPRVMTSDGMQGQIMMARTIQFNGTNQNVGLTLQLLPHLRRESTDLTTLLTFTEAVTNRTEAVADLPETNVISIQTNVAVATRIQIPGASGVFLLNADPGPTNGRNIGVMISLTVQQPKR